MSGTEPRKEDARALRGRRVLVTAGPTWVRIDAVRHISNFSSGRTGLAIASELARRGAAVTLLLGPVTIPHDLGPGVRVVPFVTFDDLHALVRTELGSGDYHAMLHAAAVSDYRPVSEETSKLPSGEAELVLRLRPTPKIVDEVKPLAPGILLVKFKLEVGRTEVELHAIARASAARSGAELVVANDLSDYHGSRHLAWILDAERILGRAESTPELAETLAQVLADALQARGR